MDSGKRFIWRSCWELSLLLPWPIRPRSSYRGLQLRSATATARMSPAKNIARRCVNCRNTKIAGGPFPATRKIQTHSNPPPRPWTIRTKGPRRPIAAKKPACKEFQKSKSATQRRKSAIPGIAKYKIPTACRPASLI
jgi:hypothetical protein